MNNLITRMVVRLGLLLVVFAVVIGYMKIKDRIRKPIADGRLCSYHLCLIEGGKRIYAEENHLPTGTIVTVEQILPSIGTSTLRTCPTGGRYEIGPIGTHPTCSLRDPHAEGEKALCHTWVIDMKSVMFEQ